MALDALVGALVPASRDNRRLRDDLAAHATDILTSPVSSRHTPLTPAVLHHPSPSTASLRFTNLLARLQDQPVLARKHEALLFLYTLATSSRAHPTPFLATLHPPATRPSSTAPSPVDPRPSKHKSKADILRDYRARTAHARLPEHLLLRDTLYLLQGISGKYVQLSFSDQEDTNKLVFQDDTRYIIPSPVRSLIHRLAEVGHLYSRVDAFVKDSQRRSAIGMIEQSLCHHLQAQLTEYYRLVAVLESQMSIPITDPDTDSIDHAQGGALVNLIHSYTDNGDPFVRKFTDQLLEEVSKPFFSTLHKWLFSGELYDPYNEFFVSVDPDLAHVQYLLHPSLLTGGGDGMFGALAESGLRLWQAKYRFREDMLPMFVGEAFGKKIFSTGKSLNFIRYSCHDSDWVATRERMSNTGGVLKYSDIAGLERSIDSAYSTASQRLFEVFIEKFRLMDHLLALKHYLLLGYGDFAEQLMEALGQVDLFTGLPPSLARPANTLYRHNLTATLETAVRTSNAQNDPPDVLRRLDARMLEYSHGETGWDVFTLEYKVDAPIDTILDPDSMVKYLKLFNHLWKMKRIESTLGQCWMRIAGASRTFLRLPDLEYDWHQIRIVMAEMIHFVRQMQAYCQLEVIACSWKTLTEFFQKREGDLDAMIEAHRSYLDRMVKKENLLTQVRDIFQTILQFREATENFYHYCLSESARRDQAKDVDRGVYSAPVPDRLSTQSLSKIRALVREYSVSFSDSAQSIVHALQSHPDLDCRFLSIRLSFSDFYRTKKEHQLLQKTS
ncbi:gamma-tubulin complex, component 3 [Boletus edulis]|nr:gamma-tubulin complex, component 3 [Boletus edulis]